MGLGPDVGNFFRRIGKHFRGGFARTAARDLGPGRQPSAASRVFTTWTTWTRTTLTPRQREALVLRYYLDMTEDQAADAMRVSRGTVKSATSRAIAAVGRMLREES
jgi:Sigma-70, region 4